MENLVCISPTLVQIPSSLAQTKELRSFLTYIDKKVDYEIKRLKDSLQWSPEANHPWILDQITALKAQRSQTLVFEQNGVFTTYSGLAPKLAQEFGLEIVVDYALPESELLPYANKPQHEARYYQLAAHDALLAAAGQGPCRISISTGLGKSTLLRMLIKTLGLKTLVQAPSTSIATQLYDDFVHHFGKKYVGFYGGGKKEFKKLITVGIDDSLTKIEEGSDAWEDFSKISLYAADESHLLPSQSLSKVALGVARNAPYRLFFSATQLRNDGLDLVLDGLTGPTVYTMTTKEGVDQGYLAQPIFKIIETQSASKIRHKDPNKQTRTHQYYNQNVNDLAVQTAQHFVRQMAPVLILVEEIEQFTYLLKSAAKHQIPVDDWAFAHAPLTKENRKSLDPRYHAADNKALVADFNKGAIQVLVGTSAIATGTDITSAEVLIYLMGKSSEIKVRQAIGRGTRGGAKSFVFNPWTGKQKDSVIVIDFDVENIDTTHRHALARQEYYYDSYPDLEIIRK